MQIKEYLAGHVSRVVIQIRIYLMVSLDTFFRKDKFWITLLNTLK